MQQQLFTSPDSDTLTTQHQRKPENQWIIAFRMFYANKAAVLGLGGFMVVVLVGLFGPALVQTDPFSIVGRPLLPPSSDYYLGTDYLGRDVFVGLVYGAQRTLMIAFSATVFTVVLGVLAGAVAGFFGGIVDNLLMRIAEFFLVVPSLVLAMVIVGIFSPSFATIIVALGIVSWPRLARLTRAEFLKLKEREFVMAERAVGAPNRRLIFGVILPNAFPPLMIAITLRIGETIIHESALSFLGLTPQGVMTWGRMIGLSRDFFFVAWWTVTFPGLAILFTVLCIGLIGDGLNDAFNPKLRGR